MQPLWEDQGADMAETCKRKQRYGYNILFAVQWLRIECVCYFAQQA